MYKVEFYSNTVTLFMTLIPELLRKSPSLIHGRSFSSAVSSTWDRKMLNWLSSEAFSHFSHLFTPLSVTGKIWVTQPTHAFHPPLSCLRCFFSERGSSAAATPVKTRPLPFCFYFENENGKPVKENWGGRKSRVGMEDWSPHPRVMDLVKG